MKALALLSGGLDSILAAKVVQEAGVEVEGIHFLIPFIQSPDNGKGTGAAAGAARQLNIKLHYVQCGEDYLQIIEKPYHGYGKRMNPCLDCRIYTFRMAARKMKEIGASFLVTGEVFDQRPNSQRRDAMDITVRDAGLKGLILRPLSAKHLQPTIPELEGWIDRSKLLDIKGRGRTQQIELAAKYGITDYPAPTGGCLLTYEEYSHKVRDLIQYGGGLTIPDIDLLRIGRHLRLSPEAKIIIGKDQHENELLQKSAPKNSVIMELADYSGPITLYLGPPNPDLLNVTAAITAGFTRAPLESDCRVNLTENGQTKILTVKPISRENSRQYYVYQV